jgi:hypothetical protein
MLTLKATIAKKAPLDRALQRLAGAVLIQALQDASSGPRRSREDALEWIYGRARGKFNFEFCCSLLGRDPDDVRQRLQRHHFIPKPVQSAPTATAYAAAPPPTSYAAAAVQYLPD